MSEERTHEGEDKEPEKEKPHLIIHKLEYDGSHLRKRRRTKKKYRKKGLYRKRSTIRRKVKKRWLNNRRTLKQLVAFVFILIPLIIILLIMLDGKFHFLPWHYLDFLFHHDNG